MEPENDTYKFHERRNQEDKLYQAASLSSYFSPETYHSRAIRKPDKPQSSLSEKILAIRFLLCNSCFWCASCLDSSKRIVTKCPCCNKGKLESMPISDKESYRFRRDSHTGVILEFSKLAEDK